MQAVLVANAGVLLSGCGVTVLIDGLFHGRDGEFSGPMPETLRKMERGEAPFESVDYLLFTHGHSDHFSQEVTAEYLVRRGAKGVFLPPDCGTEAGPLLPLLKSLGIRHQVLPRASGLALELAPGVRVRFLPVRHLDRVYWDTPHFALLLDFWEKRLLFTADADYTVERFEGLGRLRAVFLNPLFFHALRTGTFFHGGFLMDLLCVYHLPFPDRDRYGWLTAARRDCAGWPEEKGLPVLLTEPEQRLRL